MYNPHPIIVRRRPPGVITMNRAGADRTGAVGIVPAGTIAAGIMAAIIVADGIIVDKDPAFRQI